MRTRRGAVICRHGRQLSVCAECAPAAEQAAREFPPGTPLCDVLGPELAHDHSHGVQVWKHWLRAMKHVEQL